MAPASSTSHHHSNHSHHDDDDPQSIWIYHERQEAALCGQHALNNLVQAPIFSVEGLAEIAWQLDQLERNVLTEQQQQQQQQQQQHQSPPEISSNNIDAAGNFSIQVLQAALQNAFHVTLSHLRVVVPHIVADITDIQGFLCHKSNHWFAIRTIGGRYWNLNSFLERPEVISHFALGTQLQRLWQQEGYTIFAIVEGLPRGGREPTAQATPKASLAAAPGHWHRMSDLLHGRSTTPLNHPWQELRGAGRRLDGGSGNSSLVSTHTNHNDNDNEDDDLQRALLESSLLALTNGPIPDEPPPDMVHGVVRLQLRLPHGQRLIRRFYETDSVQSLYALMHRECQTASNGNGSSSSSSSSTGTLELRYGFPPKDLLGLQGLTMGQAKLDGESIQGRYL